MKQIVINRLLALGCHNWEYKSDMSERVCKWSGVRQIAVFDGLTEFRHPYYWQTVE